MDTSEPGIDKRERQRRRRSLAEKRRIVEETLEAGASVARVARAHGINANQVFHWRRQYRQGLLGEGNSETVNLLPVQVSVAAPTQAHRSSATAGKTNQPIRRQATRATCGDSRGALSGAIQVEFATGQLRVTGSVDAEALRVVLEQLLR